MSEKAVHNSVLTLKELAKKWAVRVGADSVEKINEIVEAGKGTELILVCEAMQQNAIYDIARSIRREKKDCDDRRTKLCRKDDIFTPA